MAAGVGHRILCDVRLRAAHGLLTTSKKGGNSSTRSVAKPACECLYLVKVAIRGKLLRSQCVTFNGAHHQARGYDGVRHSDLVARAVSGWLTRAGRLAWRIAGEPAAQVGRSWQQRAAIVGAGALSQAMHEQIELVQHSDPVAGAGEGRGHQRRAHCYPDCGADFVAELAD